MRSWREVAAARASLPASVMRLQSALAASGRVPDLVLVALGGLLVAGAIVLDLKGPLPYLIVAVPVVLAALWAQPAYGYAALVGLVLLTEQYPEVLAEGIEPWVPQALPIFENIAQYTPLSFMHANIVELWLVLLAGVWFLRGVSRGEMRVRPVICPVALSLAALTVLVTFVIGVKTGGDFKIALWEVRALGYLFGLAWLVPQLMDRRRDMMVLLWVIVGTLGIKAFQGLYRYFVALRMQLALEDTFMAHEDPVMFVPLFFLLILLVHYRLERRLTRFLAVTTPILLAVLALTQRRVAYVSLILCGAFLMVLLRPAARWKFAQMAAPAMLVIALYGVMFYGTSSPLGRPIARALQLFEAGNTSNQYRVVEEENLRHTIDLHPWGVGYGQPFEMLHDLPKTWVFYDYIPHNEILWIWVKSGTLGFIVVMYFFARVIAEAAWAHRVLRDPLFRVLAAVVAIAVFNQLVVAYYELQLTYTRNMVYLGTLLGLLGRTIRWDRLS